MGAEIGLLDGFCGYERFLVAKQTVFFLDLETDVIYMLVDGF